MTLLRNGPRLAALLGIGGMGSVYEGFDEQRGRPVAVKVLHREYLEPDVETTVLARFRREALTAAQLGHPNIVEVLELVEPAGERPYIVMELVEGLSLKEELEAMGPLPPPRAVSIALEVLAGLEAAHAAGVVHRDLKPSNVILADGGSVKIVDFGIAKLLDVDATRLTSTGALLGTPPYMAPEQMRGGAVDGRADIYSVGATLYHALSGVRPYDDVDHSVLLAAAGTIPLPPLLERRPSLDPRLCAIVERAMARRPEDRFATPAEMASALSASMPAATHTVTSESCSSGDDDGPTRVTVAPTSRFDPSSVRPGDLLFDKFVIDRLVGRGGMGVVFAARHQLLDRMVALKVFVGDNEETKRRFVAEARLAARIAGEHVCSVMDVGISADGHAYAVFELLEGVDLARLLRDTRRLPVDQAIDYVLQILSGVADAHAARIVHRDLKPSNIFLARTAGRGVTVKVLDFGISKDRAPTGVPIVTKANMILGSPNYMAPEQIRASASVDARADIWSMGVILYELLGGALPFPGVSAGDVLRKVLQTEPVPLAALRPDLSPALTATVMKCLAKDPSQRFPDTGALASALMPFAPPTSSRAATTNAGITNAAQAPSMAVLAPRLTPASMTATWAPVATPTTSSGNALAAIGGIAAAVAIATLAIAALTLGRTHTSMRANAAVSAAAPHASPPPAPEPAPSQADLSPPPSAAPAPAAPQASLSVPASMPKKPALRAPAPAPRPNDEQLLENRH